MLGDNFIIQLVIADSFTNDKEKEKRGGNSYTPKTNEKNLSFITILLKAF